MAPACKHLCPWVKKCTCSLNICAHGKIPSLTSKQEQLQGQLIEVFKYLNRFNNVSPIGLFDNDFNDRT